MSASVSAKEEGVLVCSGCQDVSGEGSVPTGWGGGVVGISSYRGLTLMTTFKQLTSLEAPPPHTAILGVKLQHITSDGDTNFLEPLTESISFSATDS